MCNIELQGDYGFIVPYSETVELPLLDQNLKVDGFSLAGCIRDIIDGRLNIQQLNNVICNEGITSAKFFLRYTYPFYVKSHWQNNPSLARKIFYKLYKEGRIVQPRLNGKRIVIGPTRYTPVDWYKNHEAEINSRI
jgi:hypothetical protein